MVCAAGASLAPADRKLYALRDVTGTVESVPLIASSIMSKKIAEGASALVLDVKVGSGAFMKDLGSARELAATMVELGAAHGVRTVALLTGMDTPLGRTAGNGLEVAESVEVLAGGGPPDVVELTVALAGEMLAAAGLSDVDPAAALADGRAMDVWRRMIAAQDGDPDAPLPTARETHVVAVPATGVLTRLDAYAVGVAAWRLGAGRARKEDPVSPAAGVVLHAKPGDPVTAGEPLLELHTDEPARIERAVAALDGAVEVGAARPGRHPARPRPDRGGLSGATAHPGTDHRPGARRQADRRVRRPGQLRHARRLGGPDERPGRLGGAGAGARLRRGDAGAARHRPGRARRRRARRPRRRGRPDPGRRAGPLQHPRPTAPTTSPSASPPSPPRPPTATPESGLLHQLVQRHVEWGQDRILRLEVALAGVTTLLPNEGLLRTGVR